jgi:hypothetical protein
MLKSGQFWILTALALIAGALAGTNAVLFVGNQKAQAEVGQRSQYIQQSIQLEGLFREIVKALADLSVRNQDSALRDMLAAHGINLGAGPAPSPAAGGSSAETKKRNP